MTWFARGRARAFGPTRRGHCGGCITPLLILGDCLALEGAQPGTVLARQSNPSPGTINLNSPGATRRHADLSVTMADLDSACGSRVNGSTIEEAELRDGDVVAPPMSLRRSVHATTLKPVRQ